MFSFCLPQYVNIFSCKIPIVPFLFLFCLIFFLRAVFRLFRLRADGQGRVILVSLSGGGGSLVCVGKIYTAQKGF